MLVSKNAIFLFKIHKCLFAEASHEKKSLQKHEFRQSKTPELI